LTNNVSCDTLHLTMKNAIDLKKIRKELKLTQAQFAEEIGVSRITENRWENNQTKPSKLALKEILRLLKKKM
jgi:putative transcriptional regulator